MNLRVNRIGDHTTHEMPLVEADQAVDVVVSVGLALANVVAHCPVKAVVVEDVAKTDIVGGGG